MESVENINKYTISKHAMERYAERIMGKDTNWDVNKFILANTSKIETDINKLIQFGSLIYSGKKSKKDGKNSNAIIYVYLRDCWVVLVDNGSRNVITLYKIDLGLDEEFNKCYVSKMAEKLKEHKDILDAVEQQVKEESNTYREMIADAEAQIKEYRGMIKNLEELCAAYKTVIENNNVKVAQANKEMTDTLNTFIGKKEF